MAASSVCPCQTWRRHRSWSSNWNPQTTAPMSAESAIVQEHQHAHLMSLVSEQTWDNASLSICGKEFISTYQLSFYPFYIHIQHDLFQCKLSVMPFSVSLLLTFQHNPTMLSSTLTHLTQSESKKETTIPTTCNGLKKILRPQTVS